MEKIKKKIKDLIAKNKVNLFWHNSEVNILDLFFENYKKENILSYAIGDNYLMSYTKIINFFKANKVINESSTTIQTKNFKILFLFKILIAIKYLFSVKKRKFHSFKKKISNYNFTNQEIHILLKIIEYSKKNSFLIINKINYASENDLLFFRKIIDSNFINLYTKNLRIIFISNKDYVSSIDLSKIKDKNVMELNLSVDALYNYFIDKTLYSLNKEKFSQYIKLFNYDLDLLSFIISKNSNFEQIDMEETEKIRKIIMSIIKETPHLDSLEIAAVIGLTFDINTLNIISNVDINQIAKELDYSYNEGLLLKENNDYNFSFLNEFIRDMIYKNSENNITWHEKYANKLNSLMPNEYIYIAFHYFRAKNLNKAYLYFFSYLINLYLDNKKYNDTLIPFELEEIKNNISKNIFYDEIYHSIILLGDAFLSDDINETDLKLLDDTICEQYYIVNYFKLAISYKGKIVQTEDGFINLSNELEKYFHIFSKKQIIGLEIQAAFFLIDINSYRLNRLDIANKVLKELSSDVKFISNTPFVKDQTLLFKLTRKKATLFNAELAYEKMRIQTEILIKNPEKYDIDEFEKLKFLSDYLGFTLYAGQYKNVNYSALSMAKSYIGGSANDLFTKTYKIRINCFLIDFFNDKLKKSEIKRFFRDEKKNYINGSFYKYDLAAIAMYCSNYDFAEKTLLSLYKELDNNKTCFYHYCYNSNLASLYILKKDFSQAKYYNDKILNENFVWEDDFINIMKFRAEAMNKIIKEKTALTADELFNYFQKEPLQYSTTWRFLGKGILFSELMYYRE